MGTHQTCQSSRETPPSTESITRKQHPFHFLLNSLRYYGSIPTLSLPNLGKSSGCQSNCELL